jgi:hypothetical protein
MEVYSDVIASSPEIRVTMRLSPTKASPKLNLHLSPFPPRSYPPLSLPRTHPFPEPSSPSLSSIHACMQACDEASTEAAMQADVEPDEGEEDLDKLPLPITPPPAL